MIHLLKFFPRPFQEGSRVSYKENSPGGNPFDETPVADFGFEKLSRLSEIIFCDFFPSPLVWWCRPIPIFPSTCKFSSLGAFLFFLGFAVLFLSLFIFFLFSLWTWHIFLSQIPFLYPDCVFLLSSCFSFFAYSFMLSINSRWLIFFCDLVNL